MSCTGTTSTNSRCKIGLMALVKTKNGGIAIVTGQSYENETVPCSYSLDYLTEHMMKGDYSAWIKEDDLEVLIDDITPDLLMLIK